MDIAFETQVKNVGVGDTLISPFSGKKMLVRSIKPGMYGLVELSCLDAYGDRHLLSVDPEETVKVIDA